VESTKRKFIPKKKVLYEERDKQKIRREHTYGVFEAPREGFLGIKTKPGAEGGEKRNRLV